MSDLRLRVRARLVEALDRHIPPGGRVALVGGALHRNPGDSAIMLATLDYVRRREVDVAYFCYGAEDYHAEALAHSLGPDGIVVLRGGGSINDIWPAHQAFRQRVLADHPERQVVQLPQSIFFRDPRIAEEAGRAIRAHASFSLLARDEASLRRAQQLGATAELCPDMAFFLGPQPRPCAPRRDLLVLARRDPESAADWSSLAPGPERADWWRLSRRHGFGPRLAARFARELRWRDRAGAASRLALAAQRHSGSSELGRGARLLSSARVVVTDRLHAHILCLLLGVPHVLVDNLDGKVFAFHRTWTEDSPLVRAAATPAEALELARELIP
jgi:exopolysaccharide biosynthesis predicted pyruvyltransferase EpsI